MPKIEKTFCDCESCVVCGNPHINHHHVFYGVANRKISDRYGYIIPLCQKHHTGNGGIHFNKDMDLHWKQRAQRHFEANHGTRDDFRRIFGRSYL